MNYLDLPLEERIQKAMEYALILVADERPGLDIINELKAVFGLTEHEAKECYSRMRKQFNEQYNSAIRTKIRFAWTSLIASTVFLVFFSLYSAGVGWFFLTFTFLWGLVMIGAVTFLARHYREKAKSPESGYFLDRERLQKIRWDKKGEDWTISLPLFFFILVIAAFYFFYSQNNVLDTSTLFPKYDVIISDKVDHINTSNRFSSDRILFRFKGFQNIFEFDEKLFKYGNPPMKTSDYLPGDTVSIEMLTKDAASLQDGSDKKIILTNIAKGVSDNWLIDHGYRNKKIAEKNKKYLLLAIASFIFCLIIVFIWIRYRKGTIKQVNFVQVEKIHRHDI
jgi:hypothetical protein